MKALRYLTAAAVCVILFAGCRENDKTGQEQLPQTSSATSGAETDHLTQEEEVVLTNRQKEILTERGLSTNFSELTDREKNAIISIERALVYLEDKYGEPFIYTGYVDGRGMENEHMTAYPEAGSMGDVVTVYISFKNNAYSFTDDYVNILTMPVYQAALKKLYLEYLPEGIFYSQIRDVRNGEVPDEDNALWNTSAVTTLIFDEKQADSGQVDTFLNAYAAYMEKGCTGLPSALDVYLMSSETIQGIYFSDFENSMLQADYSYLGACSISADGRAAIRSRGPV